MNKIRDLKLILIILIPFSFIFLYLSNLKEKNLMKYSVPVYSAYRYLLKREPDEAGFNFYKNAIKSGDLTIDDLENGLKGSEEYKIIKEKEDKEKLKNQLNVYERLNIFYKENFEKRQSNKETEIYKAHGYDYSDNILNKLKSLNSLQRKLFFKKSNIKISLAESILSDVYDVKIGKFLTQLPDKSIGTNKQGSAYIDVQKDKLFIVSADGDFYYANIKDDFEDELNLVSLKSNIVQLVNFPEFYEDSMYGIKDILLKDDEIFISFLNEIIEENCWGVEVAKSKLGDELKFKKVYEPKTCVSMEKRKGFWPHVSGGKMADLGDYKIALSVGALAFKVDEIWPPDDVDYGKIVEIDLKNKTTRHISKGHRNPQGLFFSEKEDLLLSTEHGPAGGDELNFINVSQEIKDYGWPKASYGFAYGTKKGDKNSFLRPHAKYGYEEPKYYWTPSIGISAVEECSLSESHDRIFIGSLGLPKTKTHHIQTELALGEYPKESLSIISFSKDNFSSSDRVVTKIGGRIRDLVCDEKRNIIWFWDETKQGLGKLKLKD